MTRRQFRLIKEARARALSAERARARAFGFSAPRVSANEAFKARVAEAMARLEAVKKAALETAEAKRRERAEARIAEKRARALARYRAMVDEYLAQIRALILGMDPARAEEVLEALRNGLPLTRDVAVSKGYLRASANTGLRPSFAESRLAQLWADLGKALKLIEGFGINLGDEAVAEVSEADVARDQARAREAARVRRLSGDLLVAEATRGLSAGEVATVRLAVEPPSVPSSNRSRRSRSDWGGEIVDYKG